MRVGEIEGGVVVEVVIEGSMRGMVEKEETSEEETPRNTHIRTRSNPVSTFSSTPTSRSCRPRRVSRENEKMDHMPGIAWQLGES